MFRTTSLCGFKEISVTDTFDSSWMPGAGFQIKAANWKKSVLEMRNAPFEAVLQGMVSSNVVGNFN
jgi:hypothetical protein